ncbi:MAG: hypothetical protein RIQ89_185 [Bacteroidota bacterium]|jgi:lipoprotein-releasing system permease protein
MSIVWRISSRYFLSRKSQRVTNFISALAVIGITAGTAAMIIILSVLNGFEGLIKDLYNKFDPDISITSSTDRFFKPDEAYIQQILNLKEVAAISKVYEDQALLSYNGKQYVGTIKGVDEKFILVCNLSSICNSTKVDWGSYENPKIILGSGIAYHLQVDEKNAISSIDLYAPLQEASNLTDPINSFNKLPVALSNVFSIQQDYDQRYALVSLPTAHQLFGINDSTISKYEVRLKPGVDFNQVIASIKSIKPNQYNIATQAQLHQTLYNIMQAEKWIVIFITAFILLIASFSLVSAISMLIIEKSKDVSIFSTMGSSRLQLQKIFFLNGLFIAIGGMFLGLAIGLTTIWVQKKYGLVGLGVEGNFIIEAYPVDLMWSDVGIVILVVIGIGIITSAFPALTLIGKNFSLNKLNKVQ